MAKLQKYLPILSAIKTSSPYPTAAFASALPFQERLHHKNTQTQKFLIQTTWISCSWQWESYDRNTLNVPGWNWFGSVEIALAPLHIPLTQTGKNRSKRRTHKVQPYSKMKTAGGGPAPEENTKAPCRQPS